MVHYQDSGTQPDVIMATMTSVKPQREELHRVGSRGYQAQASKGPLPGLYPDTPDSPGSELGRHVWHADQGNSIETQHSSSSPGAGHVGTLCLAETKIPEA